MTKLEQAYAEILVFKFTLSELLYYLANPQELDLKSYLQLKSLLEYALFSDNSFIHALLKSDEENFRSLFYNFAEEIYNSFFKTDNEIAKVEDDKVIVNSESVINLFHPLVYCIEGINQYVREEIDHMVKEGEDLTKVINAFESHDEYYKALALINLINTVNIKYVELLKIEDKKELEEKVIVVEDLLNLTYLVQQLAKRKYDEFLSIDGEFMIYLNLLTKNDAPYEGEKMSELANSLFKKLYEILNASSEICDYKFTPFMNEFKNSMSSDINA